MLPVLAALGLAMVGWIWLHPQDGGTLPETVWAVSILKVMTPILLFLVGDAVASPRKLPAS
jgi:hypothetical protein